MSASAVNHIEDLGVVHAFLMRDPIATAYQLGDLSDAYRDLSQ